MYQSYKMDLAGRPLVVDINRVGKQANGCAFMHYGDTTVLCTATASEKPRDGIDFFPLSVEYPSASLRDTACPNGRGFTRLLRSPLGRIFERWNFP